MNDNKPSVALLTSSDIENFFPFGGILSYIENFIEMYDGQILHLTGSLDKKLYLKREVNYNNKKRDFVTIFRLNKRHNIPDKISNIFYAVIGIRNIKALTKDFDFVYAHSAEEVLPLMFFSKRIKLIYHMHGALNPFKFTRFKFFRNNFFQNFYERFVLVPVLKKSRLIITINQECVDLLEKYNITNPYHMLPNIINSNLFKPIDKFESKKHIRLDPKKKYLLYAGRLNAVKGLHFLVDVYNKFLSTTADRENYVLLFAGDGEDRTAIEEQVKKLDLQNNVKFAGLVEYKKLPYYFNSAEVFFLSSYNEGTPMVLLEAMATGIPIICSNTGNSKELLKNYSSAKVLDNHDVNEWVTTLNNTLKNDYKKKPFVNKIDFSFFSKGLNKQQHSN